ncbi:MAG: peptide chain release factor N(5)-glutamine methyltransferase [Bacteroidales bacterium]|nr:peptide chain release factor N(5)-glutamine methyltransferase [Bacteroidales bacterium]
MTGRAESPVIPDETSGYEIKNTFFQFIMDVPSNKTDELRKHYVKRLEPLYGARESESLVAVLFRDLLGISRVDLVMFPGRTLKESDLLRLHFGVKSLLKSVPVQYVTGKAHFSDFELMVGPGVLIPRPETEEMVELIIREFGDRRGLTVADIGTGSGCIALALKKRLNNSEVFATDVSSEALAYARRNAWTYDLDIRFSLLDILDFTNHSLYPAADIIVSNPPYIPEEERETLPPNILFYEPARALFVPGRDPVVFYSALAHLASLKLKRGGTLFCELHERYGETAAGLMKSHGFTDVRIIRDMQGKNRILAASGM